MEGKNSKKNYLGFLYDSDSRPFYVHVPQTENVAYPKGVFQVNMIFFKFNNKYDLKFSETEMPTKFQALLTVLIRNFKIKISLIYEKLI